MFKAALFTIARTCKQSKCPSTEERIKKMWYIYTVEYYSAIKKKQTMLFTATWMDLEMVILREVSQSEKDKYHTTSLIVESKKRGGTNELIYKTEMQMWKTNLGLPGFTGEGGTN